MRGSNVWRFVALIAVCLAVVAVTAAAQASNKGALVVNVTAGFNTVKVSFTTPLPTAASVNTSIDRSFALTVLDRRLKKTHNVTIRALAPATTYNIRVVAQPLKGKPATWTGSFQTQDYGSTPMAIAAKGSKITLNGAPFFVIANKSACPTPAMFAFDQSAGINVEEGITADCPDSSATPQQNTEALHSIISGQVGWRETSISPDPASLAGLPELLNWGSGIRVTFEPFFPQSVCGTQRNLTVPLYQLANKYASSGAAVIYSRSIGDLAKGPQTCLTRPRLANIFWSIVEAGGAGIEYAYEVDQGSTTVQTAQNVVLAAAKQAADQIATLEAAFGTGKPIAVKTAGCSTVKPNFISYGGVLYAVAVNNDDAPARCTFSLPKAAGPTVQRLWEGGNLKLKGGTFSDSFVALGVHLYKVMPAITKK